MATPSIPAQILAILSKSYPAPESELNFKNEYELLVCVMLSAQCTDKKVNEVTPKLFSPYPNFEKLSKAPLAILQKIIRPINYYKTKAKNLKKTAILVCENYSGQVPKKHEELLTLPGIGNKSANVILGELKAAHTLPVDTHVFRVSKRLGLASGKNVLQVEEELKKIFQPKSWRTLHHCLILHGRRICKARRPLCAQCPLNKLCPSAIL